MLVIFGSSHLFAKGRWYGQISHWVMISKAIPGVWKMIIFQITNKIKNPICFLGAVLNLWGKSESDRILCLDSYVVRLTKGVLFSTCACSIILTRYSQRMKRAEPVQDSFSIFTFDHTWRTIIPVVPYRS